MINGLEKIIDADVHPWINQDIKGLFPYLSKTWQKNFDGKLRLPDHSLRPPLAGATSIRADTIPPSGGVGGSDPHFVIEDHLNKYQIEYAILSSIQAGKLVAYPNPHEAAALAQAFNDYFLNEWTRIDSRFKLAMSVAVHDPHQAAQEIRRIGHLKEVVAVFMPLINTLMGNRYYDPIYEAAEEHGLPILIHPTGTEGGFSTSASFAGGVPTTYIERHTVFPEIAFGNLANMIFEGTFIRFPKLMLLVAEFGYSWAPHLMWRMDQNWRNFRREVPWLQKPPSTFVLDHVRFTSQPAEEPEKAVYLQHIFDMIHAEKTLIFSTDYPHWDSDMPDHVYQNISPEMKKKIFYDNAMQLFGLQRESKLEV